MTLAALSKSLLEQGSVKEHPLMELLGLSFQTQASGVLEVRHARVENRIYFFNGIPINANSSAAVETLLEVIARDQRLSPEDMAQIRQLAAEKNTKPEECAKTVLDLDSTRLYYYEAQAAKEIIIKTCGYRNGEYKFVESEEALKNLPMFDLNPLEIIYEGMTRYHITNLAAEIYEVEHQRIKLNPRLKDYFLLPRPLYEHSHLLDLFQREVPLSRALSMLMEELKNLQDSIHFLYLLLVTGILEFAPEIPEEEIMEDLAERAGEKPASSLLETGEEKLEVEEVELAEEEEEPETFIREEEGEWKSEEDGAGEWEDFAPTSLPEPETEPSPPSPAPSSASGNKEKGPLSAIYAQAAGKKEKILPLSRKPVKREEVSPPTKAQVKPSTAGTQRGMKEKPKAAEPPRAKFSLKLGEQGREKRESPLASKPAGPSGPQSDKWKKISAELDSAPTLYQVLGVTVEHSAAQLEEAFLARKRVLLEQKELSSREQELLKKKLEQAYHTLSEPARRIEYERSLFPEEEKRAWNMKLRKALARKMNARGEWYLQYNAAEYAEECFKRAVDLDPEQARYYMNLGWARFRANPAELESARNYINSALKINPKLDMAYYYLGLIAKKEEDMETAEEFFRKALMYNPNNSSAQRELSFLAQGRKEKGFLKKLFGS